MLSSLNNPDAFKTLYEAKRENAVIESPEDYRISHHARQRIEERFPITSDEEVKDWVTKLMKEAKFRKPSTKSPNCEVWARDNVNFVVDTYNKTLVTLYVYDPNYKYVKDEHPNPNSVTSSNMTSVKEGTEVKVTSTSENESVSSAISETPAQVSVKPTYEGIAPEVTETITNSLNTLYRVSLREASGELSPLYEELATLTGQMHKIQNSKLLSEKQERVSELVKKTENIQHKFQTIADSIEKVLPKEN